MTSIEILQCVFSLTSIQTKHLTKHLTKCKFIKYKKELLYVEITVLLQKRGRKKMTVFMENDISVIVIKLKKKEWIKTHYYND